MGRDGVIVSLNSLSCMSATSAAASTVSYCATSSSRIRQNRGQLFDVDSDSGTFSSPASLSSLPGHMTSPGGICKTIGAGWGFCRFQTRCQTPNCREEAICLQHSAMTILCTLSYAMHITGSSMGVTWRCMLPFKNPSDDTTPSSPPDSFSPTETASPPSPLGDPFFETPEFNTPEYVDTPTTVQSPGQPLRDPSVFTPDTASPFSPQGDPFFETPEFDSPELGATQASVQVPTAICPRRLEEIWSISTDSSSSSRNTCTSPSLPDTIRYEEVIQH